MSVPRLITIGPSHFCEKARWGLQRHGIAFQEEPHVPMLHWRHTRPYGRRTVPLLVTDDGERVGESTDILRWADRKRPAHPPLIPTSGPEAAEVERLVAELDRTLGVHARRAVYGALLPSRALTLAAFAGHPRGELLALRAGFPVWRRLIVRGLGVVPAKVERSRDRVREAFAEAGRLLMERRYLAGDTFTAADLTLAAHGALAVLPPQYGWPLPDLAAAEAEGQVDAAALAFRNDLRATPAGQHVLRLYATERSVVVGQEPAA